MSTIMAEIEIAINNPGNNENNKIKLLQFLSTPNNIFEQLSTLLSS